MRCMLAKVVRKESMISSAGRLVEPPLAAQKFIEGLVRGCFIC